MLRSLRSPHDLADKGLPTLGTAVAMVDPSQPDGQAIVRIVMAQNRLVLLSDGV
jgi:hypothetical protein